MKRAVIVHQHGPIRNSPHNLSTYKPAILDITKINKVVLAVSIRSRHAMNTKNENNVRKKNNWVPGGEYQDVTNLKKAFLSQIIWSQNSP